MNTQPTMSQRKSFPSRLFLLLILACPTSLVWAQTNTTADREKSDDVPRVEAVQTNGPRLVTGGKAEVIEPKADRIDTLASVVKEQQELIRRQQNELENILKRLGGLNIPGTLTVGEGTPIKHVISITQSLAISDPNGYTIDLTVPGAQPTDLVMIGAPDSATQALVFKASVISPDTVRVRVRTALPSPKFALPPILCRIVVIGF